MINSYVRGGYQSCEEAIQLIHRYNGIACLAHPWLYFLGSQSPQFS